MKHTEKNNGLDYFSRVIALVAMDAALVMFALIAGTWAAASTKGNEYVFPLFDNGVIAFGYLQIVLIVAVYIACFACFRMYRDIWTTSGVGENFYILAAVAVGTGLNLLVNIAFGGMYKFNLLFAGMLLIPLLFLARYFKRILRKVRLKFAVQNRENKAPLLIVGAGFFGAYVLAQIQNGLDDRESYVAAFVDDDPAKVGTRVQGVRVLGTTADIPAIVNRLGVREIIIAIPSIAEGQQANLVALCKSTKCRVRMVTPLRDMNDQPTMRDVREIRVDDILFRPEVMLDKEGIREYIQHKTVLVTGGGGSIGSEICRQLAAYYPERLIIFDIYENNAYELQCEFRRRMPWLNVVIRIGSVRDRARLDAVMEEYHPAIVLHCAAHKHVPLMEDSPAEAIKNNVFGTLNVLESADAHGVTRFVQLSTDKAVNPTNVMGASKRVTELVVQEFAKNHRLQCMTVRFGNVLGSQGSVVPLFENQIKNGGPVLVTDPEITRYFMTIPEAAQLVLQAGAFGESGAVYVLDMGEPVKILDLAERLIRYYGYVPYMDIPIEFIGLRPGEKMYEELMMDSEEQTMEKTQHNRILRARPTQQPDAAFSERLTRLIDAAQRNEENIIPLMQQIVPNFEHAE